MGEVIGFELNSQEPEKAAAFYKEVFGWEITEPKWGYQEVRTGGMTGGISEGPPDFPHGTRIQVEVDSIDECLKQAESQGARVVRGKMEFDHFYLAYLVDPTGVGFGLMEKKTEE